MKSSFYLIRQDQVCQFPLQHEEKEKFGRVELKRASGKICPFLQAEEGAGRPDLVPGWVWKVGEDHEDTDQRWLRQDIPEVAIALPKKKYVCIRMDMSKKFKFTFLQQLK